MRGCDHFFREGTSSSCRDIGAKSRTSCGAGTFVEMSALIANVAAIATVDDSHSGEPIIVATSMEARMTEETLTAELKDVERA